MLLEMNPKNMISGFNIQFFIIPITITLVLITTVFDIKFRKIPNIVTLPGMIFGVAIHSFYGGWAGVMISLGGMLFGGGILLIFYLLGGMGAGDVKLMGSVGALLGLEKAIMALIFTALIGGILAIFYIFRAYGGKVKFKFLPGSGRDDLLMKRQEKISQVDPLKIPVPYGVAIGIGTLITIFYQLTGMEL